MNIFDAALETGDLSVDADVVVVGSGASGSVVAKELAEAGQRVVVLEEGSYFSPEQYGSMRVSQTLRLMWRDAGFTFAVGLGDTPLINVMMGKCVGGSSVLTGGVCFRIPDKVLHQWQEVHRLNELSPSDLEPAHEAVEKMVRVQEVPESLRSRSTQLFGMGAQKLGYSLKPLRRNIEGCQGFSRCNFGCPKGAKLSVDRNYLPDAVAKGAQVISHALVEGILVEGNRAVGVRGRLLTGPEGRKAGKLRVRARRVVLAAGAYHSPLLMLRSGIGNSSEQVGRNLTLHPAFRIMARFESKVEGWRGAMQSAYADAFESEGITLLSVFPPPGVLAATMPGVGDEHHARAQHIPYLAMFGGMVHDHGGGRVQRGIGREPLVTYRLSEKDHHSVGRLLRIVGETFFAAGANEVFLPVFGFGGMSADEFFALDFDRIPRKRMECSSQHPLGTCRMGVHPGNSVVDPDGQSWDVKELFVADGSILPTSLGVNPQIAVMTMATRIAWKLRERPFI